MKTEKRVYTKERELPGITRRDGRGRCNAWLFTEETGKGRDNRYEENEHLVGFKVIIAYRRVYGSSTRARTRQEKNKEKKREESAKKERKKWTQNVEFVSNRKNRCTT